MTDRETPVTATRELKPLILFDGLDVDEIRQINALTTTEEFPSGHRLFSQDDPGDSLYVIVHGRVRIEMERSGKRHTVATLEAGGVLGELGMVLKDRRSANAIAETDVKLLRVPRDQFRSELQKGSVAAYKVVYNIAKDLAHKLQDMNRQLEKYAVADQPGELAQLDTLLKDWTF